MKKRIFVWLPYLLMSWWLPWWSVLAFSFVAGATTSSFKQILVDLTLVLTIVWLLPLIVLDVRGHHVVSERLSELLGFPWPPFLPLAVTLVIFLLCLVSAAIGFWSRHLKKTQVAVSA